MNSLLSHPYYVLIALESLWFLIAVYVYVFRTQKPSSSKKPVEVVPVIVTAEVETEVASAALD